MLTRRDAIATTRRVGESAIENGFAGNCMIVGVEAGFARKWKCKVLSHDEETRRLCSLLYATRLTGASCALKVVCSRVFKSTLRYVSMLLC